MAGRDLAALRTRLFSIGIQSEYGGEHNNHATQMALVSFPDGSYLELIGAQLHPDPAALAKHYWAAAIQTNAGPCAFAVRATDIAGEVKRLQTAGVAVTTATKSGRDRPDHTHIEWESAPVGLEPNGMFFPFVIHDLTARTLRAMPKGKPTNTNFTGIAKVVIAVRDLPAAVARYQKAYGLPQPLEQNDNEMGARLAAFEGTPVILASALNGSGWLAKRLTRSGEGPCAFLLGGKQKGGTSHWFGRDISWFDQAKLGWRLGVQY